MRKKKIRKRMTAAVMAVCLILTGGWTGTPVHAYASPVIREAADNEPPPTEAAQISETQSGTLEEQNGTHETQITKYESTGTAAEENPLSADQQDSDANTAQEPNNTTSENQGLSAILGGVRKYFMSLKGTALGSTPAILPGVSLPEKTTSLTFPANDGNYYLVIPSDPGVAVTPPASHEAALNAGWIKKIGTDGSFVWTGLAWNTSYHVYETDLSTVTLLGERIATNKGQAGGTILIEGDLLTGNSVTASLDSSAPTTGGTWSWYCGSSADGWTGILLEQSGGAFQIPGPETAGGQYLKTVFTAAGDYEGSVEFISSSRIASQLTGAQIAGTAAIGEILEASVTPAVCEPGVRYSWYRQAGESSKPETDTLIYTGKSYKAQADDIGKKLYVKAVSLEDSVSKGTAVSASTETVVSKAAGPAGIPEQTGIADTSVTVKMPDGSQGLYQFAWSTTPNWNPAGDTYTIFDTMTRNAVPVTILELSPSTTYEIRARQVGENGWLDSDWGTALSVRTLAPALKGGLTLSGSCTYGKSLTAALESPGQAGGFQWYRVNLADKTAETEIPEASGQSTYTLKAEDIGCQLRVIYRADGITNSGEISVLSDLVEKQEQTYPEAVDLGSIQSTDNSLTFTMPAGLNHVIAGYSEAETGVPQQVASGRIYNGGDTVEITGLERNTVYYLFIKYAETETHMESNWSPAAASQSTKKTVLSEHGCAIKFTPSAPAPGNVLTAELTNFPEGEVEGTWTWMENIPGGGSVQTSFRQDVDQPLQTSYIIPADKTDGTTYTVSFTGEGGLTGVITGTSQQVKAAEKTPYPTPGAPALVTVGDTSLTVAMEGTADGIYSFSYSEDAAAQEGNRTSVDGRYYGESSAVITGLSRNKTYYVWARQNASEDHEDSAWSQASEGYKTAKTYIGGNVRLSGEERYGHTLTAVYTGASYMPEGDDSGGSFCWYRGTVPAGLSFRINGAQPVAAEPVYSLIAGENAATYTVKEEDIGCYIKAEYRGTGDFQGTKEAASQIIGKDTQTNPAAGILSAAENPEASAVVMKLKLTAETYYQIRKSTDEIPEAPESAAGALASGWKKAENAEESITLCYTPEGGETLKPNTEYTVYTVIPGTSLCQPSQVVKGNTAGSTQYLQTGTLNYRSVQDNTGGQIVTGGELEAGLQGANSLKGTWKWYVSVQDYKTVDGGTEPDWTQLVSGYLPTVNSETSRLTLTEEMLGHYIRAEFVADSQAGYSGTVGQDADGNGYYGKYVKKIYKETVTLESSASDGYGDPAAYEYSVLTATVNDYAEKGKLTDNRSSLKLKIGADDSGLTAVQDPDHENRVTFTLPATNKNWDQKRLTAEISLPQDPGLYVDEKMAALTVSAITSQTETDSGILYKYGISINTKEDLTDFILKRGKYSNWSNDIYIITSNIRYPESDGILSVSGTFSRILDGDYHTVSGLLNPLFQTINSGTVKNLILNKTNVDRPNQGISHSENAGATIALNGGGNVTLHRVFLSQANVSGGHDVGYFIGKVTSSGTQNIEECASAGGLVTTKQNDRVVGGFMGYTDTGTIRISNSTATGTEIRASGNNVGGGMVVSPRSGDMTPISCTNVVVASKFVGDFVKYKSGGAVGIYNGSSGGTTKITNKAVYYDSTLTSDPSFYEYAAGKDFSINKGVPMPTKELISSGVKDAFDQNINGGSESIWTYTEGFYPRLNWIASDPICALFSATRGAFTSPDGNTSPDNMFEGNISGPIEIPQELQKEGYSFQATGSLTVDESGLVIPVSFGSGKVIVSYADDLTSAENTYEFTVTDTTSLMKKFQSVAITNGMAAKIGTILQAQTVFDSSDTNPPAAGDVTYRWYRRKNGTTGKTLIPEGSGSTYEVQPKDAGYTIMVKAEADGYWEMGSAYSALIEMTAPSMAPAVTPVDYQTVEITGRGGVVDEYEFAYAKPGGDKIIVPNDKDSKQSQTITGLEANTDYEFYSRIPAREEGSLAASGWSAAAAVRTGLIPLEGTMTLSGEANVDQTVIAQMPDTNLQKGTWSAKVIKNGVSSDITASLTYSDYQAEYQIQPENVEGNVSFTFTPLEPYGGEARTAETAVIGAAIQTAPSAPVLSEVTDSRIYLTAYSDDPTNTVYEYGLKGPADSDIRLLAAADAALGGNRIVIQNLYRNTTYEIYARKKAVTGYQEGRWSPALTAVTDRTEISGLNPSFSTQNIQVEGTVTVTAPSVSGAAVTGEWKLERVDPSNNAKRATLNDYIISADGTTITYGLTAADADYLLCATLVGNGNFKGNAAATTGAAVQKKEYPAPAVSDYSVVGFNDSSVTVEVTAGKEGTFQFGYQTAGGAVVPYEGSVQQGSSFTISPLNRGTAYQIYMKRLAETGYTESAWSPAQTVSLDKTEVNGTIRVDGNLAVGVTMQASYESGNYAAPGDSDAGGAFTWKLTDGTGASTTYNGSAYEVKAEDRGRQVTVTYTPPSQSKFKGAIEWQVGVVVKAPVTAPDVPEVQAVADTGKGSTIKISNAEAESWYKILPASESRPEFVMVQEAVAAGWIKAESAVLEITGLNANTDYIVYGAKLETESTAASTLTASSRIRSGKEELGAAIAVSEPLKPMVDTKVTVSTYNQAPDGTWYWYASKEQSAGYQLIRSNRAAKEGTAAADTFQIPYDYSGYYIKIVFQADGDFTGEKTWISANTIEKRQISGSVSVTPDGGSGDQRLFEQLTAAYGGTDDQHGTWIWYRQEGDGSFTAIERKLYQTAGTTSSYTPGEADKGKVLKAEYTAGSFGCMGSVSQTTAPIVPAEQNTPEPPAILQTVGTSVQLSDSAPGQAKPYGERPAVAYGYRKALEGAPQGEIQWNGSGTAWVRQLEPNTEYEFYARYEATNVYAESSVSQGTRQSVRNGTLSQSGISLVYESEDDSRLDVGKKVKAVYSGEGYAEGAWKVSLSTGKEITADQYQTEIDGESGETSCTYVIDMGAVSSSILFTYTADGTNYSGSVTARTDRAVRKPMPAAPEKPAVSVHQDTDFYLDGVKNSQEYALTTTPEAPGRYSGLWKVLEEVDGSGRYNYTGLERDTTYYVHTRVAETDSAEVSETVTSDPVTTLPYFGLAAAILTNKQDILEQPKIEWEIAMPDTLALSGRLDLESVTLKFAQAGGYEPAEPLEPYGSFVSGDGTVGSKVYEAGSRWANDHYGTYLEALDSGGTVLGSNHETPSVLTFSGTAEKLRISLYRANAVSMGGDYILEILLRDENGTTALLHGEVEITTQIQAVLPVKISLRPENGRELVQTSSAVSLKNPNGMPVEILLDEKAEKGSGMPDLLGKLDTDPLLITAPGAFYMKATADGSDYRYLDSGIWLDTRLAASNMKKLARLGVVSDIEYQISGVGSMADYSWPWEGTTIDQAYGLKFCCQISEEDQTVYKAEPGEEP